MASDGLGGDRDWGRRQGASGVGEKLRRRRELGDAGVGWEAAAAGRQRRRARGGGIGLRLIPCRELCNSRYIDRVQYARNISTRGSHVLNYT